MKWAIHQLSKYRNNGMPIDEIIQLDEVMKRNPDIRKISPVHVKGHCTFGAAQMTCHFQLTGTLTLPCARTWEDVEYPFDIQADELFSWSETPKEDVGEISYLEGDVVNVDPLFEELILVEIPIQVFKENTENLPILGGKNWSYSTDEELSVKEENEHKKLDPRLADLAKYFDRTDE
ncbi:DUF177 domain-containing protein [Paenisporosarcina sp. TG20]|uniref:YceD family protein n=1 Tax=Paenisporosarcina sp. TG20 TaxID=1211706 RepID=UPI0002DF095C|nr:YceD family protein [Paenisporosarcina sp. TG20]